MRAAKKNRFTGSSKSWLIYACIDNYKVNKIVVDKPLYNQQIDSEHKCRLCHIFQDVSLREK